jgi:hypothetical protein
MSDVLDNERAPAARWVVPVAVLAVVALVVALGWRWGSSANTSARPASPSPLASPAASALPSPSTAANGCGGDVDQPLVDAATVPPNTGLRILVGDRDLQVLDVDAGTTKVLATRSDGRSFTQLAQTATRVLAVLRNPCSIEGYGKGIVGAVDPASGAITSLGAGDAVLPGEPPTVLDFDASDSMSVRELGSTRSTPVPKQWQLHARTSNGYFASVYGRDDVPPEIGVGSPQTSGLTTFGGGTVVAASPELLFWLAGECPGEHCLLTSTTVEGENTAQSIDTYAWGGTVSPDGMKLAFRKSRASGQLGAHPGPPNDIAILDRATGDGRLTVLRGVVLPPKGQLTLTWSPDSQWLVIGADLGSGPAVLIWRTGMERPARIPMPPTDGGTTGAPALLVLPR